MRALENPVVNFYLPNFTGPATQHTIGNQINYLALGNVTNANQLLPVSSLPFVPNGISYYFLSDVHVVGTPEARSVVALGNSITDGLTPSTPATS